MPFSFYKGLIASVMIFRIKTTKVYISLTLLLFLGGCSVWDNFTTYFNLYFNTASLFEDAENEILSQKRDLFSNDPLVIPGTARNSLVKVIEKSSKILQFNSETSYVDEALMMLGKSFYYQSNYQKSKRKFEELLATSSGSDEEITEANLWIAKCHFELREFTQALKLNGEVRIIAIEQGYDDIIKQSYVQEIKYRIKEEDYAQAITLSKEFADVYDDGVVRAQIYYELGNLYTKTKDNENAILAYEKVFDYQPDFDLEIIATIKYADALRNSGQAQKALEVFEDIRTKDKFSTSYNEIDYEIGKTLVALGNYDKAYNQFRYVDTTYKNTQFASTSNFEMGELYRTRFLNYDSAGYYYSKAASATLPIEYQDKARSNNLLFSKYKRLRSDINKYDRQLFYSQNPQIFFDDSTDYVADSIKILTEYLEKKELQDIWKGTDTLFSNKNLKDSTFIKDSIFVLDSLVKVDSLVRIGMIQPLDTIGLKQSILDSLEVKNLAKLNDPKNPLNILNQSQSSIKLDSVKFKGNPPRKLKISIDSAKTILAKNSLELGNLFLTELDVADSALANYNKILENYQSPVYYPNTLYALGSYYLTIDNKPKADSLFKIIYDDYKGRTIVNAAADKLKLPLINLQFDPAKDQYAAAEDLMQSADYKQSLNMLFNIYRSYPKSPVAPQALYTSGWIYENNLSLSDSAAAMYDTLIAKYPTSVYVKQVAKKISAYKQEKARLQKAAQDSINALVQIKQDSTVIAQNSAKDDSSQIITEAFGYIEPDEIVTTGQVLKPKDTVDINNKNTIVPKKKLEPLWDPRKHFN